MTTATNQPGRSRPKRTWRFVALAAVLVLGLLVLAVLTPVVWLAVRDASAHGRLIEEMDAFKAAGLPYDNATLTQYYAQATDERDVDAWLELLTVIKSSEFAESAQEIGPWKSPEERVPFAFQPWPAEAETLQFLQRWDELRIKGQQLALYDRAVRFPIEFDSIETELPWTQTVRELGRLFQLDAQVALRREDSGRLRDAVLAIFGTARSIEGQPFLVSQLLSIHLEQMAINELRCALQADVLTTADLRVILARLDQRRDFGAAWRASMAGERGGTLPLFTEQRKYMASSSGNENPFVVPWRSRDALNFLDIMNQAIAVPTKDLNEFHAGTVAVHEGMTQKFTTTSKLAQWDMLLSSSVMPAIDAAGDVFIRREMLARLATLGIGVRLYEDKHGVLPERLEQLSELGLDVTNLTPLGDRPFGFRHAGDRVVLWGFSNYDEASTPAAPPDVGEVLDDEFGMVEVARSLNRIWVWEFPRGSEPRAGQ